MTESSAPRSGSLRKAVLWTAGIGALAVVLTGFYFREDLMATYRAWKLGYYVYWVPDGVRPSFSRSDQLSNDGRVAVIVESGEPNPRAAIWHAQSGELEILDALPGAGQRSRASSFSPNGKYLIGTTYVGDDHLGKAWIWSKEGGMVDIGSFGAGQVAPTDVNDEGVVVGWAAKAGGRFVFRWSREEGFQGLTNYDYPGYATAINEAGWIVGCREQGSASPFLSRPGLDVQLIHMDIEYMDVSGRDVNGRGEVLLTGFLRQKTSSYPRAIVAFLWTKEEGHGEPLAMPPGSPLVRPVALNDRGWILFAGAHDTEPGPSFILRDREFHELPVPEGASHAKYEALNNEGWVLGRAKFGSEWRGFVLRPFR